MKFDQTITRRESIRKLLKWSGCLTLAGATRWPLFELPAAKATPANQKFIIEGSGQTNHYSVKDLTQKVFEAAGGIRLLFSVCRQKIASNRPIFHPRSNKIKHLVIRSTTKLVGTHILL
jgi:hypothetical protein